MQAFHGSAVGAALDCAASDKRQARAIPIHNAPAEIAKAGVEAKDAGDFFQRQLGIVLDVRSSVKEETLTLLL